MVLDLENLDNTLKLFDRTYCVEAIRPFRPPKTWSNRGRNEPDHSLGSEASGRVDRGVARQILLERALDKDDQVA